MAPKAAPDNPFALSTKLDKPALTDANPGKLPNFNPFNDVANEPKPPVRFVAIFAANVPPFIAAVSLSPTPEIPLASPPNAPDTPLASPPNEPTAPSAPVTEDETPLTRSVTCATLVCAAAEITPAI